MQVILGILFITLIGAVALILLRDDDALDAEIDAELDAIKNERWEWYDESKSVDE